jgi:Ankyrin repeat
MPSAATQSLFAAFDGHDTDGIRDALAAGADATSPVDGKAPVDWLLEQYTRSDRLGACLRLLFARGAVIPDPALAAVLLDDAAALNDALRTDPTAITRKHSLVSTFVPLTGATLLHVAAEYGNLQAARTLVAAGAEVNAPADIDEFGLNGHPPIFHTVNSNRNRAEPILRLLLEAGARPDVRLAGLHWGKGFEWETTFFDVTPISFAHLGLLPQVHRDEREIFANIALLLQAAGRPIPPLPNVPNRYLQPKT